MNMMRDTYKDMAYFEAQLQSDRDYREFCALTL